MLKWLPRCDIDEECCALNFLKEIKDGQGNFSASPNKTPLFSFIFPYPGLLDHFKETCIIHYGLIGGANWE